MNLYTVCEQKRVKAFSRSLCFMLNVSEMLSWAKHCAKNTRFLCCTRKITRSVNLLSGKFLCTTLFSLSFFRLKLNILKICFAFGEIICETIKEGAPELRLIVSSESWAKQFPCGFFRWKLKNFCFQIIYLKK